MDEVKRLINNFDSDFDPQTVSLEELESHSIELGRVPIDYKKKQKILFQDQANGAKNHTITEDLE